MHSVSAGCQACCAQAAGLQATTKVYQQLQYYQHKPAPLIAARVSFPSGLLYANLLANWLTLTKHTLMAQGLQERHQTSSLQTNPCAYHHGGHKAVLSVACCGKVASMQDEDVHTP